MSNELLQQASSYGQINSVQLNIVTFVNVYNALSTQSMRGNIYMIDNSIDSTGTGTPQLQTVCKPGQTLNWIIYAMDMAQRADGSWPPMVKINNIVFLDENGSDIATHEVCSGFKIFGGPDKMYSQLTPVYYYWAGTVLSDLPVGVYQYRFVLELDEVGTNQKMYLNTIDNPSIKVIAPHSK